MRLAGVRKHSLVDGPDIRYAIFFQGCPHGCPGCHNPDSHDLCGGEEIPVEQVINDMLKCRFVDGITLSGGDPFMQPEAARTIAKAAKEAGLSVWAYTGWTIDQLMADPARKAVLDYVDVVVDGPFVESLKVTDPGDCLWRGSANQRLIQVADIKNI